jgi:hypothetical protein
MAAPAYDPQISECFADYARRPRVEPEYALSWFGPFVIFGKRDDC